MYSVHPSPCRIVSSDTSMRDAVKSMQDEQASYVVIENNERQMVGILTTSDLLKRFDVFSDSKNWGRPVSLVMSQPVKYLTVDFVHTCSEFMTENKIKHVPIVSRDKKLLGVVTADSIMKALVHYNGLPPIFGGGSAKEKPRTLGVLSPDGSFHNTLDDLFKNNEFIGVDRLMFGDLQVEANLIEACKKYDGLVIDLDDAPLKECVNLLRKFNASPDLETVVLVYSEKHHDSEFKDVLSHLDVLGQFLVYSKPVDFVEILNDLNEIWAEPK